MAAILQVTFSNEISSMKNHHILIQILFKFVSYGPIDHKPALV